MESLEYLRVLLRRWRWVVAATLASVALAILLTQSAPPVYQAVSQVYVSAQAQAATDVTAAVQGSQLSALRVGSYSQMLASKPVAEAVVEELGLAVDPNTVRSWISAQSLPETTLIDIYVRDVDPERAAAVANAVGKVFPTFVDRYERTDARGGSPVRVSVVQEADVPGLPISPRPRVNLALGLLLGLLAGSAMAYARELLDKTIRDSEALASVTGSTVLGSIAFDKEAKARPLVVQVDPQSPRSEAYRQLRTNLQFLSIDGGLRSFVVTSSLPGEGKSTTSCNLAITLAQSGIRVILVEADLRRPAVQDYMGIEGAVGLTSVLIGRAELDDVLQPWGDGTLQVLAAGPIPPNPSELLGSDAMMHLIQDLEKRADVVIFDTPPLLPVTDGAVLAARTDGALLVVRADKTSRDEASKSVLNLQSVGAQLLGSVLNMTAIKGADAYAYGYSYAADRTKPADETGRDSRAAAQRLSERRAALAAGGNAQSARSRVAVAERVQGPGAPARPPAAPSADRAAPERPSYSWEDADQGRL